MDKKNTILLTIIAVATLLVAVVGATFAYFSLAVTGDASTTQATVKADEVGTATLTSLQENLTLSLTAADMVQGLPEKTYYAVAGDLDNGASHEDPTPIKIAQMTYSGGTDGSNYVCPVQVEVTVSGDMLDNLQEGWTLLELTGDAVNGEGQPGGPQKSPRQLDLSTLKKTPEELQKAKSQVYKGRITLNGPDDTQDILSATLSLTNKNVNQSKIANSTLTVTVNVTPDGECTFAKAE